MRFPINQILSKMSAQDGAKIVAVVKFNEGYSGSRKPPHEGGLLERPD